MKNDATGLGFQWILFSFKTLFFCRFSQPMTSAGIMGSLWKNQFTIAVSIPTLHNKNLVLINVNVKEKLVEWFIICLYIN